MSETIALIPARGGSERILQKNIRTFRGRPIIAWPIEAARRSKLFDRIIVSTDDHDIAETARREGAEIPFIRPAELANNKIGIMPVIQHAIQELQNADIAIRELCLIYATAPFLRGDDLRKGRDALRTECCDYAMSVTTFAFPIQRAFKKTTNGRLAMFLSRNSSIPDPRIWNQHIMMLPQFCWGTPEAWLEGRLIYGPNTVPIMLPRYLVQDIDTEEDWQSAEWMFSALRDSGEI